MPSDRESILRALDEVTDKGTRYWSAFPTDAFFQPLGGGWSAAENVRHLVKSTRPVMQAIKLPRLLLRLRFGKPRRPSVTYDALVARYGEALDAGGKAGRFTPSPQQEADLASWRARILGQLPSINAGLRAAIARWPEAALDRYQLPHPLLGNLTIREMLFFTIYHQHHHIAAAERRQGRTV